MTINERNILKEKLHNTNAANKINAYIQTIKELNTTDDLNELPGIIATDNQISDNNYDILFDLVMRKIEAIKNGEDFEIETVKTNETKNNDIIKIIINNLVFNVVNMFEFAKDNTHFMNHLYNKNLLQLKQSNTIKQ